MVSEERFEFTSKAQKSLLIVLAAGVLITILGFFTIGSGGGHGEAHGGDHHGVEAKADSHDSEPYGDGKAHSDSEHADSHGGHGHGHHAGSPISKRFKVNLWINSVYFAGIAFIGVFFFAIQYVAQAGWSAGIKRIPMAFGSWLPIAFLCLLVVFLYGGHDIFHWTHSYLYDKSSDQYDSIIDGKGSYFFWPLENGAAVPVFWLARLVIFFGVWYLLFRKLRSLALQEDLEGGSEKWYQMRKLSAIFLVFFAVSSSVSAWDWMMSIDTHWFSTMFGWYSFASWWVAGLALSLFIILTLKDGGYLSVVNENHIHDLGKFVFAFTIFWTYTWFSQFLLIYYAHIPEETVYFMERWKNDHYAPVFFINLILNFFLPFLLLMTRDSKRYSRLLKVVCVIVVFGHWLDFYLMATPGTLGKDGGFGFMEIGLILVFASSFLFVVLKSLAKAPLYGKNHPMLQESLHHHI